MQNYKDLPPPKPKGTEPEASATKKSRQTKILCAIALVAALLLIAGGVGLLTVGAAAQRSFQNGATTEGVVSSHQSYPLGLTTHCEARVTYTVNGVSYTITPNTDCLALHLHQVVTISYLPKRPWDGRMVSSSDISGGILVLVFALVPAGVCWFLWKYNLGEPLFAMQRAANQRRKGTP